MKSAIGQCIQLSLFGESHGEAIGVVIQGLPSGILIDQAWMQKQMEKRKPKGKISTQRQEADIPEIVSGVFEGRTTGTPLCILIRNENMRSKDYSKMRNIPRPSHADYTAQVKYQGFQDYRGGGHFSGRITAPLVAAGAIFLQMLKSKGIEVGTHVSQMQEIMDEPLADDEILLRKQLLALEDQYLACIQDSVRDAIQKRIEEAQTQGDSMGGILESAVVGMPAGVGEPFFDSVESKLAHLLFSIGAVKGVEFGDGFDFAAKTGSEANDGFAIKDGQLQTLTNHNGGINGGITNGMPLRIRTAVKPTPSIYKPQSSVNLKTGEAVTLQIEGRHDPAILHRARVVVDSMIALGLVDLLTERFGILWWKGEDACGGD
ncbi:chorismate synthase [Holdemania massiliensis]|uniref:Chorismate synthase n=1 Tax=Holdemania massiliensis TaxID=1468449 RepID=A0A6N7S3H8_9FIRM|nr:chorismate synthase [Holdemania massiliensis]MSA70237.1 chorismate synthase [Holdemania massiliensis]MSA88232.1 chorismate synthase [Holdemania massiliensis]MSB77061.1 chorismate synthase [Holdemania massiliensis]MSC31987.1 chorismate synthase [Holdemania massiliensis]MSC38307.1 chorismate synthase [Holdemania massiliensis]